MTVVDGPVGLVEVARAVQKIAKPRSIESMLAPIDLRRRARPRDPFEDRPVALRELPIETAIVRDRDHPALDEGGHGRLVGPVAGHHFAGDARERRNLGRDGRGRLVEGGERVPDADDPAGRR